MYKLTKLARFLILAVLLSGCGGTYYDYLQGAITGTRAACTAGELAIVAREGSSKGDDKRDIARIRDACDRAYRALDELGKERIE